MIYSKVKAAGAAGAAMTIAIWIAGQYGLEIPQGVGESMVVLTSFIVAYAKKELAQLDTSQSKAAEAAQTAIPE